MINFLATKEVIMLFRIFDNEPGEFNLETDVIETENDYILKSDVPGIDLKDIDISIDKDHLMIESKRSPEKSENERFNRVERKFGTFRKVFSLPESVDQDSVQAKVNNGVLTLVLNKSKSAGPKKIKVLAS